MRKAMKASVFAVLALIFTVAMFIANTTTAFAAEGDTTVKISVTDDSNQPLSGALVTVSHKGADGSTVQDASWTSTNQPHELTLSAGTYTVKQTAPQSYTVKDAEKTFTITAPISTSKHATFTKVFTEPGVGTWPGTAAAHVLGDLVGDDGKVHTVVYCFNNTKKVPETGLGYERMQGNEDTFVSLAHPNHKSDLYSNVSRVIWNGYPNDASGIKEKYNLTNDEFAAATQWAIWHYTDNTDYPAYRDGGNFDNAYLDLVDSSKAEAAPANMVLDIYKADNDRYQNAVTAHFYTNQSIELSLANTKSVTPVTPETPKPQTPTTPVTPSKPTTTPSNPSKPAVQSLAATGVNVVAAAMSMISLAGVATAAMVVSRQRV
ncbi:thioester-forming surface-anchored protein [Alloscardovia venturai]|uniref:Thioester-forming surface-anchored protein n=1 Tax=Alloscardovia venturai TaxID=1769421 RepID=A0ABW2Y4C1_9BIFI